MLRGLYTSALGMTTQMKKMDVITNNIANSDTAGFKRDIVATQSFSAEMMKRLDDQQTYNQRHSKNVGNVSLGAFVDDIKTDFSTGSLRQTDGTLDLAISGNGYFAIQFVDRNGNATEKYSRDGGFTLTPDGTLVTKDGFRVVGEDGGEIKLPTGEIDIDETGTIFVNSEIVGKIKLVDFENPESLRKYGHNFYDTTAESVQTEPNGLFVQGYLENSNANSVREMVEMIATSRLYETNSRFVTIQDQIMGKISTELPRK